MKKRFSLLWLCVLCVICFFLGMYVYDKDYQNEKLTIQVANDSLQATVEKQKVIIDSLAEIARVDTVVIKKGDVICKVLGKKSEKQALQFARHNKLKVSRTKSGLLNVKIYPGDIFLLDYKLIHRDKIFKKAGARP